MGLREDQAGRPRKMGTLTPVNLVLSPLAQTCISDFAYGFGGVEKESFFDATRKQCVVLSL